MPWLPDTRREEIKVHWPNLPVIGCPELSWFKKRVQRPWSDTAVQKDMSRDVRRGQ